MKVGEIIFSFFNYKPSEPLKSDETPYTLARSFVSTSLAQTRQNLFDTMAINQNIYSLKGTLLVSNVPAIVKAKVDRLISNKAQYQKIASYFKNNMPWWIVGLIHEMEAEQNFTKYLGNGQSLYKKTTIVPKGRGPFQHFNEGAIDALQLEKVGNILDWSIGNVLYFLEGFNGYGYSLYKGINSPYLWSGSNQYKSGKYIRDAVYDKNAVSCQIGTSLLIKEIQKRGLL